MASRRFLEGYENVNGNAASLSSGLDIVRADKLAPIAEFLIKFGFLGVGLFLLFLAIVLAITFKERLAAYIIGALGLGFVTLFGVINVVTSNKEVFFAYRQPIVFVRFTNLAEPEQLSLLAAGTDAPRPYSQQERHPTLEDHFNQKFVILREPEFNCMTLIVSKNRLNSVFDIRPVEHGDADGLTEIIVTPKRSAGKISSIRVERIRQGKPVAQSLREMVPLPPAHDGQEPEGCAETEAAAPTPHRRWAGHLLFRPAHAQLADADADADADVQKFAALLQSNDVFTRRGARRELAKLGQRAVPVIDALLKQDNYRLQLGALEALSNLPESIRRKVLSQTSADRQDFLNHRDETMREVARRAFRDEVD